MSLERCMARSTVCTRNLIDHIDAHTHVRMSILHAL
jgi:hypothetical protein